MLRRFLILTLAAAPLFGQQGGAAMFRQSCANCHGEKGNMIAGVDLGSGKFRHASSDEDLVKIILNGIPGTGMPPNTMTNAQAAGIVAYLRSMAPPSGAASGDLANGKSLFASKGCEGCHRILGTGSRVGPDLSEIGSFRKAADIAESITDPDASIEADNRTFHATTKAGAQITGRVIDEDGFGMRIIDSKGQLEALNKADLRDYSFSAKSGMPSFKDRLSPKELSDLVAYLSSLKRMDAK